MRHLRTQRPIRNESDSLAKHTQHCRRVTAGDNEDAASKRLSHGIHDKVRSKALDYMVCQTVLDQACD